MGMFAAALIVGGIIGFQLMKVRKKTVWDDPVEDNRRRAEMGKTSDWD